MECQILRKGLKALLVFDSGNFHHAFGGSFIASLGEEVDYVVYLKDIEQEIQETDPAIWEEPEYKAALARRAKLRQEYAALLAAGDFEGYRDWSESSCDE